MHQSGTTGVDPWSRTPGGESSLIENPLFEGPPRSKDGHSLARHISDPTGASSRESRAKSFLHNSIKRSKSMKGYVQRSTASFFGINPETEDESFQRWKERRRRLLSKKYGELKGEVQDSPSIQGRPLYQSPGSFAGDCTDSPSISSHSSPIPAKDSVYKMAWDGLNFATTAIVRRLSARSAPAHMHPRRTKSYCVVPQHTLSSDDGSTSVHSLSIKQPLSHNTTHLADNDFFDKPSAEPSLMEKSQLNGLPKDTVDYSSRAFSHQWQPHFRPATPDVFSRIWNKILDRSLDNSDRRQYGLGAIGKLFRRKLRQDRVTPDIKRQLDDFIDHRPYFTYWVTTVQILVTIVSLAVYGFGPAGFHMTRKSSLVLVTSLSLQEVDYFEPDNFWIGPRAADLVHLGAKFTPCMRKDKKIHTAIQKERENERNTACCVRNDHSGCVQTSRDKCSARGLMAGEMISTWKKWDISRPGPPRWSRGDPAGSGAERHRLSGSVCGQDPRHCEEPASVYPFEWPDDITRWPVCRRHHPSDQPHMACEVIGRPCCLGIYGDCLITTKQYCEFVRGTFHEEAALCSQVSCLSDVCGMIPFHSPDTPDQFYRLWTSLFLHAGLIHLAFTVIIQFFIMRDTEKLAGSLRIGIIYLLSGVAGNLASAIFVPYRAEVGPAGSQFGLLACLFVEVIFSWNLLKRPCRALLKLASMLLVLFVLGLLPWVDNYAHIFGFAFGFLLSYALLPFVSFGPYDRTTKVILIWICLIIVIVLFVGLVTLFYVHPIYECSFCQYLNCIPFTSDFCLNQDTNFTRQEY